MSARNPQARIVSGKKCRRLYCKYHPAAFAIALKLSGGFGGIAIGSLSMHVHQSHQLVHAGGHEFNKRRRIDSERDHEQCEWCKRDEFAKRNVSEATPFFWEGAKEHALQCPEHVGRREDDTRDGKDRPKLPRLERADKNERFTDEHIERRKPERGKKRKYNKREVARHLVRES